jgi:hypothetical protein
VGIGGVKEVGERFAWVYQRGIIYIIVVHFKGSRYGN